MRKRFLTFVTGLVVAGASLLLPLATGQAVVSVNERPLAGLTLSLEHYCDNVMESQAENARLAKEEKNAQESEGDFAEKTEEEKEKIKLNLKYDKLGIAKVDNYLNVRKGKSESSKIIGKMVRNTGCNILGKKNGWTRIESGGIRGYVKSEYLIEGEEAEKRAYKVATLKAVVKTETLNVRYLPSTESRIYDQISIDEDYTVEKENLTKEYMKSYISKRVSKKVLSEVDKESMYENLDQWVMLSIDNEKVFVSKDFVTLQYKLNRAVEIKTEKSSSSSSTSSSSSSKASSLVSYAMQFLGNPYVWGGTSLTNGADCSGFVMSIYAHFGYSLPRTSSAQASATRTVSAGSVQVGDLFFYGSGGVSHVGMYIGNGQIIHASNARDGIKISSAYYRQPIKIGRVM